MNKNFIKTQDKETAEKLIKLGFKQIGFNSGEYVFVNDGNIAQQFSDEEMKKVYFNNKLNL